jgi:hypothetical protein
MGNYSIFPPIGKSCVYNENALIGERAERSAARIDEPLLLF